MTDDILNDVDSHFETVVAMTDRIAKTETDLREWCSNAGVKSGWSAHQKMQEKFLFRELETSCAVLTRFLQDFLPDHWGMQEWIFKPLRTDKNIKWAGKFGRGKKEGTTIPATSPKLSAFMGFAICQCKISDLLTGDDVKRMRILGASPSEIHTFSINPPDLVTPFIEERGYTPTDATSKINLKTTRVFSGLFSCPSNDPRENFRHAANITANTSVPDTSWSLGPELWTALRKHRTIVHLVGKYRKHKTTSPPWRAEDRPSMNSAEFDFMVAATLKLLKQSRPRKGPPSTYVIQDENLTDAVRGWCPKSAVAGHIVRELEKGLIPRNYPEWSVYATSDECGQECRDILTSPHAQ